ncbi:MAG TPA: TolC family protein, partial [Planctomycetaceae bacterium]
RAEMPAEPAAKGAELASVQKAEPKLNPGEFSYSDKNSYESSYDAETVQATMFQAAADKPAGGASSQSGATLPGPPLLRGGETGRDAAESPVVRGAEPAAVPGTGTPALPEQQLTLEYLSTWAQDNHPLLRRDRARIVSADGSAVQAGLYPNPRWDTNNPQVFSGPNSQFNAGIMQEFVVKGKRQLDRAAALRARQQTEFAFVQDRYQLLTAIRSQFYTTLAAQVRVEVLGRLLKITEASVKTARQRYEEALIGDLTEVKLLQIDYNKTLADLENARRVLDGERQQLAAIVGMPDLIQGRIVGTLSAATPSFDEEIMKQFITTDSALVQISKLDVEKNRILLKRAEAEPYPNITLGPAYAWGLNKGGEQYWLTVTFPIPFSDRNQGNIQAARANITDSVENMGALQLELLRHSADAFSRHRGALVQAEKYRTEIIPDSRDALRLAKSGYDNGVFDFAAFLQAQRTVMDVQKSYIDILETVWTTAADLAGLLQMDQFP